jgi:hypothetical protein
VVVVGMRRQTVIAIVAVIATVALIAGAVAAGAHGPPGSRGKRAAARTDAQALLARLKLPAGAIRTGHDRAVSPQCCGGPGSRPATPNLVDVHEFFWVPGNPRQVLTWIGNHGPKGSTSVETGISGVVGPTGSAVWYYDGFSFANRPGLLIDRMLLVAATRAKGGGTALRADGQSVWLVPRPPSERIPSGVRSIAVSTEELGGEPRLVDTVTGASRIKRIASWVDRLALAQPGPIFCPADYGRRVVLRFLSGSRVLASAVADGAGCGDVTLTIRGRSEPELTGGPELIAHLASLLHRSLP